MPDKPQPNETATWLERLESAKLGDRESLTWLVKNYWQPLWDEAFAEMGDDSKPIRSESDLLQETLSDAQNSLRDFQGKTPKELEAWLQAILTNNIRDAWGSTKADKEQTRVHPHNDKFYVTTSPATCEATSITPEGDFAEFRPSNRYRLISRIGQGGFGVVFLARDQHLNRNVALKMPRPDVLLTKSMVQRFLREARNVAKLDHPNIVPVLATDETALMPSIVYPYCSGPTLSVWLQHRRSPLSFRVVASIVRLLAEAVQHAHSRGILHRDLKLANVLLEPTADCDQHHCFSDGESSWIPRVTDFGISKATQADDDVTVTGSVMGTLEYMAPEQIRGLTNDIGSHSDVYSLGVILYELLVKQRPYFGDSGPDMILKMKDAGPPLVRKLRPEVPRDLEAIVSRCLSVSIDHRYATAAGLSEDLGRFLASRPVLARKNSLAVRTSRWVRRQPVVAALSGLCVVLAIAAIAGMVGYVRQASSSVETLSAMNKQLESSRDLASAERDRATSNATELRNQLYAADIAAAARSLEDGDLTNYEILLSRQIKSNPEEDIRELAWHYLWNKGHRQCESLNISEYPLYSVQYSNRGDLIAVCGADGVVTVFDSRTQQAVVSWNAEQGEVNLAAFSADDLLLATAGDDGSICIWNSRTGKRINRFRAHPEHVFHSLFGLHDTLISCGNDNIIRVWNWRTGESLHELNAHTKAVQSIALSADRKELYSASDDGTRCTWNLTTMQLSRRLSTIDSRALDVQPATGFPFVFSSDLDGIVRRECLVEGDDAPYISIAKVTDSAECIAVSSDCRRVAVANKTGMIYVVELDENLEPISSPQSPIQQSWSAHAGRIYDLAFAPDGSALNSVGHDGVLRTWKIATSVQHASLDVAYLMEPHSNGPTIAQIAPDACVFSVARSIWFWKPGTALGPPMANTETTISRVVASTSKQLVFAGEDEGRLSAWRLNGKQLEPAWAFIWPDAPKKITGLAYFEKENWIASAMERPRNRVNLIDAESGKQIKELTLPPGVQGDNDGDLVFSPDGHWLAAAIDNQVVVWDLEGDAAYCLSGHTSTVTAIAFHANGKVMASGSADRVVKLWDMAARTEVADLRYHKEPVTSVLFSPDGKSLVSCDQGGQTAVWHTASGRYLLQLDKHPGIVNLGRNWTGPILFRALEFSAVKADFLQSGRRNSED